MIRAGWATTYLQSGAEYGQFGKERFLAMEAQAKQVGLTLSVVIA